MSSEVTTIATEQAYLDALGPRLILRDAPGYQAAREGAVWRANKPRRYPEAIVMAGKRL